MNIGFIDLNTFTYITVENDIKRRKKKDDKLCEILNELYMFSCVKQSDNLILFEHISN